MKALLAASFSASDFSLTWGGSGFFAVQDEVFTGRTADEDEVELTAVVWFSSAASGLETAGFLLRNMAAKVLGSEAEGKTQRLTTEP